MTHNSAATLTIYGASNMTHQRRQDIARWLRRQIQFLLNHPDQLAGRYTARYMYLESDPSAQRGQRALAAGASTPEGMTYCKDCEFWQRNAPEAWAKAPIICGEPSVLMAKCGSPLKVPAEETFRWDGWNCKAKRLRGKVAPNHEDFDLAKEIATADAGVWPEDDPARKAEEEEEDL